MRMLNESVMANRARFAQQSALLGLAVACVASCQDLAPASPEEIRITPSALTLRVGSVSALAASVLARGTTLSVRAITWESQNPQVATVDASGRVTGIARGQTLISARVDGASGTWGAPVTIIGVSGVSIDASPGTIEVGESRNLIARVSTDPGVTGGSVVWSSSDPSIATVNALGSVTALRPGSVTITATCEGVSARLSLVVTQPPVASIQLSAAAITVSSGETSQLAAIARDSRGSTISGVSFAWSSSNPDIATVNSNGLVTGIAVGSATISVRADGASGSAAVTVVPVSTVNVGFLNSLAVGVTVFQGSQSLGSLPSGSFFTFTVIRTANTTWRSQKFRFSDGSFIPDELDGGAISSSELTSSVSITNIVGGVPFVVPIISSAFADTVSFLLRRPSGPKCLGFQWGSGILGATWGYYRLEPNTSLEVYRGAGCTGRSRFWNSDQMAAYEQRSGRLYLRVDQLP
jgi:uncharacterized protein YjdB